MWRRKTSIFADKSQWMQVSVLATNRMKRFGRFTATKYLWPLKPAENFRIISHGKFHVFREHELQSIKDRVLHNIGQKCRKRTRVITTLFESVWIKGLPGSFSSQPREGSDRSLVEAGAHDRHDLHRVALRDLHYSDMYIHIRATCFIYMMCHAGDTSAAAELRVPSAYNNCGIS